MRELPDVLTDEEAAAFEQEHPSPGNDNHSQQATRVPQSEPPDVLTDEQMGAFELSQMPAPSEVSGSDAPDILTDQQVKDLEAVDNFSGRQVAQMVQALGPGELSVQGAANTIQAAQNYWDRKTGWFDRAIYGLTLPEQAMARQAVNALENIGGLTTDEAKDLVSRDQVHGSDIVNVMWKNQFGQPDTWYGKTAKFVAGLAADIVLDPLSYIGVGALTQSAKAATVGGKTVKAMDRMAKTERHYIRTLQKAEQVVTKKGAVVAADDAADQVVRNKQMIASALDQQIGFEDLIRPMNLTPEAATEVKALFREGMTEKSWSREMMEGTRGVTARIGIPFTKAFVEADIPLLGRGIGLVSYGLFDKLGGSMVDLARQVPMIDSSVRVVKDLASKTGSLLFDEQQALRLSSREVIRHSLGKFETDARRILKHKEKGLGEGGFSQLMNDMVDELDNGLYSQEEAFSLAKDKGVPIFENPNQSGLGDEFLAEGGRPVIGYDEGMGLFSEVRINPLVERLYKANPQDAARAERLARHPEVMEMIDDMRGQMAGMVDEYKARGIPMEELNPFGQGWARRYVKHMVTDNFVRKMDEIGKAEGAFGEALTFMENTIGGVDRSALGRKYRGTIQAANANSMDLLGIKQFVDEPLELFSSRIQEMNKVINDFDLMKSAEAYAVRGKKPGVGWVKYNVDDFRKLVLDVSSDKADQWKVFVPEIFRGGDDVYLPEAVYDKLNFWINGWNIPNVAVPLATSLHFLDRVFRNNALFGAGYLGQNAFSNALTYLMHADYRAPMAMADSMSLFLPGAASRTYALKGIDGAKVSLSGEQLLKEAIEDGVLRTSLAKEIEFSDLAEYVASNRQARQGGAWNKAKNLFDVAMLYRLNRDVARVSDEIPKLAQYIQRRQMGFTRKGAAESAEQLYYNFGIVSKPQDVARKVIPFSSFAIKTTESLFERLKTGQLARLTIPGKVNAVFDGAFVQDHEVRKALDESLPPYKKWGMHPVHGPLMPGQREILAEIPWAHATMSQLFNPDFNLHPMFQIFGLELSQKISADEFGNMDKSYFWRAAQQVSSLYLPPPINNAMAVAEITGQADFGGFFAEQYLPIMSNNPSEDMDAKLDNAAQFGKAMADRYGKDWLFERFFNVPVSEGNEDSAGVAAEYAARGEFIRKKFRQFSLGAASMSKLDINYAINRKAIERQIQAKKDKMATELHKIGFLVDTGKWSEEKAERHLDPLDPREFEIEALEYKLESLDHYYNFILESEEMIRESGEYPGIGSLDIFEFLLGGKEFDYTQEGGPEEEDVLDGLTPYDLLSPKKTKEVLQKQETEDGGQ